MRVNRKLLWSVYAVVVIACIAIYVSRTQEAAPAGKPGADPQVPAMSMEEFIDAHRQRGLVDFLDPATVERVENEAGWTVERGTGRYVVLRNDQQQRYRYVIRDMEIDAYLGIRPEKR